MRRDKKAGPRVERIIGKRARDSRGWVVPGIMGMAEGRPPQRAFFGPIPGSLVPLPARGLKKQPPCPQSTCRTGPYKRRYSGRGHRHIWFAEGVPPVPPAPLAESPWARHGSRCRRPTVTSAKKRVRKKKSRHTSTVMVPEVPGPWGLRQREGWRHRTASRQWWRPAPAPPAHPPHGGRARRGGDQDVFSPVSRAFFFSPYPYYSLY